MVQFGMFLSSALSIDDYRQRLPAFDSLLSEFHVSPDVAFFLARPMFTHAIQVRLRTAGGQRRAGIAREMVSVGEGTLKDYFPCRTWITFGDCVS